MSPVADARPALAPPLAGSAGGMLRWLCTSNPFYVLSAGLFLAGLKLAFGEPDAVQTWALMAGLAGYTLLLAVTACLLVRFGNVWDDVRTVLLVVVLMFLATSVTFDEVLVLDPAQGHLYYLAGLALAIAVSEGILRGTRLKFPALFRLPYYLILGLFFLYPLAVSPLLADPRSEALEWSLFGFSTAAGLVFLSLLPAIRRGPEYVRFNGSPWRWPLYPWALFTILGAAVPARAFLVCWSLQVLDGRDLDGLIFGPYFLVPFGLAVAVLLLEIGLVSRRRRALAAGLTLPVGLCALTLVGHRQDAVYRSFLETFSLRVGADPLTWALVAGAAFYAYAALRRVPGSIALLTASLVALALVGPETYTSHELIRARPLPILVAAVLQLGLGAWYKSARRCLLGTAGLSVAAGLALPEGLIAATAAFHVFVVGTLVLGLVFDTVGGRCLRAVGVALALGGSLAAIFGDFGDPQGLLAQAARVYPLVVAVALAAYGRWLRQWPIVVIAALVLVTWAAEAGWRNYSTLRQTVSGLDHLVLSMVLFLLAVLTSLAKSGLLARWVSAWLRAWGFYARPVIAQAVSGAIEPGPVPFVQLPERGIHDGPGDS